MVQSVAEHSFRCARAGLVVYTVAKHELSITIAQSLTLFVILCKIIERIVNPASLITLLPTNYLILTSLPTNIITPKLLCCTFTAISLRSSPHLKVQIIST